jgi:hypothetical protein
MIFVGLTITLFILILVLGGSQNSAGPPLPKSNPANLTPGEEEEYIITSNEGAGLQQRFLKQCYLVDNIIPIAINSSLNNDRFLNLSLVTGELPGINGQLLAKKNIQPLFDDLTEKDIAGLVPKIKLYTRVGSPPTWEEIIFKRRLYINQKKSAPFEGKDTNKIFQGFNGSAGGIKSFSYTLAGTNPQEAQKVITAKLKLWFQSFNDLFVRENGTSPSDLIKYVDSKEGHREYDFKKFKFKAEVGWATPPKKGPYANKKGLYEALQGNRTVLYLQLINHELNIKQDGTIELDIEYIAAPEAEFNRPLLNILWKRDDPSIQSLLLAQKFNKEGRKKLQEVQAHLRTLKKAYYKPDGTLTSKGAKLDKKLDMGVDTKEARAAERELLEDFYREFGIGKDPAGRDIDDLRREYKQWYQDLIQQTGEGDDVLAAINRSIATDSGYVAGITLDYPWTEALLLAGAVGGTSRDDLRKAFESAIEDYDDRIEATRNQADETLKEIRHRKQKQRVARYNQFMEWLVEHERIRVVDTAPELLGSTNGGVLVTSEAVALRETFEKSHKFESRVVGDQGSAKSAVHKQFFQGVSKRIKEGEKKDNKSNQGAGIGDVSLDEKFDPEETGDEKTIPVYFVTFGDLVDAAAALAYQNPEARRTSLDHGILSGPITLVKKRAVERNGKKFEEVEEKYIVNMAHVPVSLDYFLLWYQQNIILQQIDVYNLKKFILTVADDLIRKSLGEGCFESSKQDVDNRVSFFNKPPGGIKLRGGRCSASTLPTTPVIDSASEHHYFYFYSLERDPVIREWERDENFKKGIYHFEVGARTGLVKRIVFAKQDIPGLREARITGDVDNNEGHLREKYDVNIAMVGNTLFYPGQYIYLNPRLPGASRKRAETLGIGGAHFVHEVFHIVEDKYFHTEIKAVWQAFSPPSKGPTGVVNAFVVHDVASWVPLLRSDQCGGSSGAVSIQVTKGETDDLQEDLKAAGATNHAVSAQRPSGWQQISNAQNPLNRKP